MYRTYKKISLVCMYKYMECSMWNVPSKDDKEKHKGLVSCDGIQFISRPSSGQLRMSWHLSGICYEECFQNNQGENCSLSSLISLERILKAYTLTDDFY